jgi:hypothetical protein
VEDGVGATRPPTGRRIGNRSLPFRWRVARFSREVCGGVRRPSNTPPPLDALLRRGHVWAPTTGAGGPSGPAPRPAPVARASRRRPSRAPPRARRRRTEASISSATRRAEDIALRCRCACRCCEWGQGWRVRGRCGSERQGGGEGKNKEKK